MGVKNVSISTQIKNRILLRKPIAARCATSDPSHYGWIYIRRLPLEAPEEKFLNRIGDDPGALLIERIEIPRIFIDQEWDISREEVVGNETWEVNGFQALESSLLKLGINPSDLGAPWDCDYPL